MLQKNYILLILPIKEISLQPELSSPPSFRIQGGKRKCDGGEGRNFSYLILDYILHVFQVCSGAAGPIKS